MQFQQTDYEKQTQLIFEGSSLNQINIGKYFYAAKKAWGENNGGVIPKNIFFDEESESIKIRAYGDNYKGGLKGVDKFGNLSGVDKRIGGCLVTKQVYPPGSYRFLMRLPTNIGVCTAIWMFHYEQAYDIDSQIYEQMKSEGHKLIGSQESGYYLARNHEIDIQLPYISNKSSINPCKNIMCSTWRGLEQQNHTNKLISYPKQLNDGNFYEFRFDWNLSQEKGNSVEFFIDEILIERIDSNIPDICGRIWVGLWFPYDWAGQFADFEEQYLEIKKIQLLPFKTKKKARYRPQTYKQNLKTVNSCQNL